jgi:hypothetical protein
LPPQVSQPATKSAPSPQPRPQLQLDHETCESRVLLGSTTKASRWPHRNRHPMK